jgi:hypothetical protein
MESLNRTTSKSAQLETRLGEHSLGKHYAQIAEQAFFIAVFSGVVVMAGGFLMEVLSKLG